MEKKRLTLLTFVIISFIFTLAATYCHAYDIEIDVAPNTLNIQSKSIIVTVHTNIAFAAVVGTTVTLNGVAINYWKSDARGQFVAKFLSDEIKTLDGLVIGGYNQLVLYGYDTDGETFMGNQEIMVIDNIPSGKN